MAAVYFVKEGPHRPDSYREFTAMSVVDLESKFKEKEIRYLSPIRPAFNMDNSSMYEERVVVEVESFEPLGKRFHRAGFFVIDGLRPRQAAELLK